jgi:hypothetical protein
MTDDEPLPPRPRRRTFTPIGGVAGAVLIAALGFLGGVQVEKSRGGTSSGAAPSFARGGFGGQQGGGQQQADATIGEVASVDDKSFYVTDQTGNKVKVKTNKQSKVTRSAVAGADEIHPGDTVVVTGETAASGTVVASSVVATASNATGGIGALMRGGGTGGFTPPQGATPPGGG